MGAGWSRSWAIDVVIPPSTFGRGALDPGKWVIPLRCAHTDRKSTRLNSSHLVISYAVFCLKQTATRAYSCSTGAAWRQPLDCGDDLSSAVTRYLLSAMLLTCPAGTRSPEGTFGFF